MGFVGVVRKRNRVSSSLPHVDITVVLYPRTSRGSREASVLGNERLGEDESIEARDRKRSYG